MIPSSNSSRMFDSIKIKKYLFVIIGILVASTTHGLYDLNLIIPTNVYPEINIIIILGFGLTTGYFMAKELIAHSVLIRKNNKNADVEKN